MRTLKLWLALVAYFVIGYSIAAKQTLISPELFGNLVFASGGLIALAYTLRKSVSTLRTKSPQSSQGPKPAPQFQLRFFFDAGICLWAANDAARSRYGYSIHPEQLPISADLATQLDSLASEHGTSVDMNDPGGPSPWNDEQTGSFRARTDQALTLLRKALGTDYVVEDQREARPSPESAQRHN